MPIKWSPASQKDMHDIIAYTRSSIGALPAENIVITLFKVVEKIATFPNLGKLGLKEGTREFYVPKTPFLIIYKTNPDHLIILRIFHTKRFRFLGKKT